MKKRIVLLLSVVALMVVMLAMSVGPAFAKNIYVCTDPITRDQQFVFSNADKKDLERSEERRVGKECRSLCDWSSDVCSSDLHERWACFRQKHLRVYRPDYSGSAVRLL